MGSCTISAPGGANINCKSYLSEAVAAIILDPTIEFSPGELDNIENLRPLLQESLSAYLVEFNGTEPTAPEVVTETTGFGDNIITGDTAPSVIAYAETNACDFKEMLANYKGGSYGVLFVLADGSIMGADKGKVRKGFLTQVWAQRLGIPGRENKVQSYKISFNPLNGQEFDSYFVEEVNYTIDELLMLLPVGLTATPLSDYDDSTGDVSVMVKYRCVPDSPVLGATLVVDVVKSTLNLSLTTTVTEVGDGVYNVNVIDADTTSPLVAGQYAIIRLRVMSGAITEEISNTLKISV